MKIRYYVCGIGYDANYCVTDYEKEFEDFDTQDEAYEFYERVVNEAAHDPNFFSDDESEVAYWKIQLEECEETDEGITCIDILAETNIEKEETEMKKFTVVVHYDGSISYTVEAENEDEAREIAEQMFCDEPNDAIAENICDSEACDCWEADDEEEN